MAQRSRTVLKGYFETGDVPTQSQFADLVDSCSNLSVEPFNVSTQLGPWNMDTDLSITVTPDPAYFVESELLGFCLTIRGDTGVWETIGTTASTDITCRYEESTNSFIIVRRAGGHFDDSGFSNAVANRGYIISFHTRNPA